jgi:eukaryotic-like serine/threonine-protein kinase
MGEQRADLVGQQLGNYCLVRCLGQGGFGAVYLGEHIYLQRRAAIKVMLARLTEENEKQFLAEARTIAHLKHPNIVRVLEYGLKDKVPFLVMDYVPGGTLREHHPEGKAVPLPVVVSYVKQIASALQCAHNEKLIHRDIKPENLLLGNNGEVLLSDFGIALVAQHSSTQRAEFAGTVRYASPEQLDGSPCLASDQYSLGIVVYEWLCGTRPFQGTVFEIGAQHFATPPPSLCEKVPSITADIEAVVFQGLAKDHHQRFESVEAFANALERACLSASSNSSVLEASVGPLPPSSISSNGAGSVPQVHSSRRRVIVGLIIAGGGLAGLTFLRAYASPPPTSTLRSRGTILYEYHGHSALVNDAAWSPNGMRIASASSDGTVQVWDAKTGKTVRTYTHPETRSVYSVAWSHDNTRIASLSSSNSDDFETLQVWEVNTGQPLFTYRSSASDTVTYDNGTLQVITKGTGGVQAIAWSPDGTRIVSTGFDGMVRVWNVNTGQTLLNLPFKGSHPQPVIWSPDGTWIASGYGTEIRVWNATTGEVLLTDSGNIYSTTYGGRDVANFILVMAWSPDTARIAVSTSSGLIGIWNTTTGRVSPAYQGKPIGEESNVLHNVAWSPDGVWIASGDDTNVQIWDASTGKTIFTCQNHTTFVNALVWSPDGKRIASASGSTVEVWQAR